MINVGLERAEPLGQGAVQIIGKRVAPCMAGFEEHRIERLPALWGQHPDRAVAATIVVGAAVPGFRAAEIGQHLAIGPAPCPLLGPALEVERMAPDEAEPVDAR